MNFLARSSLDPLYEQSFLILAILVFVDAGVKKVDFLFQGFARGPIVEPSSLRT
jgi:hypothetical protein